MSQSPKQYRLLYDIASSATRWEKNAPVLYGKKNDRVTEVADYDNVLIVEDKDGKRFPVHKDKVAPWLM